MDAPIPLDPHSFWRGRSVFVTGTTGFKGCWLALLLRELGANVVGFATAPPTEPSLFELVGDARDFRQIEGDVRDRSALAAALEEAAPSVVFHLAAQSLVRVGYEQPIETWDTNLMGTVQALEAVKEQDTIAACLVVTTDKVYAEPDGRGHREDDRLGGTGPYSASKAAAEIAVDSMRARLQGGPLALATARAGNTLGGGDWATDRLLPDCVRAAQRDEAIVLRKPDAVRPWQHVLDVLWGYLLLAEALVVAPERAQKAWNFGPNVGEEDSVRKLATRVVGALGSGSVEIDLDAGGPEEANVLRLDASQARQELGWTSLLGAESCIEQTVQWYAGWLEGELPADLCARDLRSYLASRKTLVS